MDKAQILKNLTTAIIDGDDDMAAENAKAALNIQLDPLAAVEEGLSKGMDTIGDQFESGEAFLPELLMAAGAFKVAMEILKPEIELQKKDVAKLGTVLIGTVKGDLHSIGKNIVGTVLETKGFDVVDIGIDNGALDIIQEAKKSQADVIALSCLMTTTMPAQKEVIETLEEMNLQDEYYVIVGGGPVTQEWASEIKSNGYGESAVQAAELVKELMSNK
ncbi:MAG: corrinoid protein [Anaerolineae bacterium]|jgi:corrinoid protein of di/trimethylamine methyltransferase|nr:corrinoid protein [Anaerolineae bacterium]MBT3714694.1 corrinoid protein [Anaerolineae bacterium]MBT4310134.1 corrinoid protein [Anaerolineae bacterium]MBT4457928.1 corrinoid protein [Anaerolineae bacterium]MBT6062500.1 corrinoid protein [Anaerolineae bacterium]